MFAGHLGVALAATRAAPRLNLGWLAAAALLLDIVLWAAILLGWESVTIPADFAQTHQPQFTFPYSHGLLGALVWSLLAAAALAGAGARPPTARRAGLLVAALVFSHWLLDALVHRPELPLAGAGSPQVGLALWDQLALALAVEAALVVAGVAAYLGAPGPTRARKAGVVALSLLTLAFTMAGMSVAPPPPSAAAMAASSLATIVAVCALLGWLDRPRRS